MSLRPAGQETKPAAKKRSAKRATQPPAATSSAQSAAADSPAADEVQESSALPTVTPHFVRRDLTVPDGSIRPGWEMWIGDHCFGRADSKELLLASFERLQSPPSSFHWREVRNRMPMRGRPKTATPEPQQDKPSASASDSADPAPAERGESWSWNKKEEPVVEEQDGFREASWETPA
jgi:hypothetical protein